MGPPALEEVTSGGQDPGGALAAEGQDSQDQDQRQDEADVEDDQQHGLATNVESGPGDRRDRREIGERGRQLDRRDRRAKHDAGATLRARLRHPAMGQPLPPLPYQRSGPEQHRPGDELGDVPDRVLHVQVRNQVADQRAGTERDQRSCTQVHDEHRDRELSDLGTRALPEREVQRGRDRRGVDRIRKPDRDHEAEQPDHRGNCSRLWAVRGCRSSGEGEVRLSGQAKCNSSAGSSPTAASHVGHHHRTSIGVPQTACLTSPPTVRAPQAASSRSTLASSWPDELSSYTNRGGRCEYGRATTIASRSSARRRWVSTLGAILGTSLWSSPNRFGPSSSAAITSSDQRSPTRARPSARAACGDGSWSLVRSVATVG